MTNETVTAIPAELRCEERDALESGDSTTMARIQIPTLNLTGDTDTGLLMRAGVEVDEWPEVVRWLRTEGPFSASGLGQRTGVHGRAVREWTAGHSTPAPPTRRLLLALIREILGAHLQLQQLAPTALYVRPHITQPFNRINEFPLFEALRQAFPGVTIMLDTEQVGRPFHLVAFTNDPVQGRVVSLAHHRPEGVNDIRAKAERVANMVLGIGEADSADT